jgi:hypothetical protein
MARARVRWLGAGLSWSRVRVRRTFLMFAVKVFLLSFDGSTMIEV